MAATASLKNPTRPEVVFRGQMVVDTSTYCIKVEYRKSGTASSFMRFPPYFYFRFGQKWLSVAYFRRCVRTTLRMVASRVSRLAQ